MAWQTISVRRGRPLRRPTVVISILWPSGSAARIAASWLMVFPRSAQRLQQHNALVVRQW